ncbi:hypothetical protein ACNFIC_02610 [Pseudomonas sp. NY15463]|uniref:hypothetical protein n=1 Tax=Pseudomonas sp. NY15463 TaxID=3400361 RepID=UPI003A874C44
MANEPQSISDSEHYMGYDIAYRLVGPIASNTKNPADPTSHFRASVTLFHSGKQVEGTLEHLQENFGSEETAKNAALAQGRILVSQRR